MLEKDLNSEYFNQLNNATEQMERPMGFELGNIEWRSLSTLSSLTIFMAEKEPFRMQNFAFLPKSSLVKPYCTNNPIVSMSIKCSLEIAITSLKALFEHVDFWTPTQLNSLALSPCTNFNEGSKRENLIKREFSKEEAEAICKILLVNQNAKDKLIWNWNADGNYWRNASFFRNSNNTNVRIVESVKNCYKDFTESNVRSQRTYGYSPCCQSRSPNFNFIKVNFDASFKASNNIGGVGVVLRDIERFVVGVTALKLPIAANAATAEAIAAVKAIETAIDMGFSYVSIEGDARVILKG
ncbi:hypothetical protein GOBAR_AA28987 [Gossypium barbadense]|uniref:RNase H type-1 domain-containing protein n=1 Tax=Gossypium barbadense TaxID=3634 RepID=A0A2P5WKT5_GOSBA|nr:hypothetical protein GOBAR_AA28987 [Gossypium barbadense]